MDTYEVISVYFFHHLPDESPFVNGKILQQFVYAIQQF